MSADKEKRELLIDSAKKEFMEKGFMKASLRKICADAGVTTGALYFFFKDKEDLFGAIVDKPYNELMEIIRKHNSEDKELMNKPYEHEEGDHDEFVELIVPHIYGNYDAFVMLLTKAQGTKYENCISDLADEMESTYTEMTDQMSKHYGKKINKKLLHWIVHMIIDAFVHMIMHEPDEKKAMAHIKKIMNFTMHGWSAMLLDEK